LARVGIAYDVVRWEERDLVAKARAAGLELELLHVLSKPLLIGRNDVGAGTVLLRCVSHNRALATALALESSGAEVVNSSRALATCEDKVWAQSVLSRAGIPTPLSAVAYDFSSARAAARELGYPVVVKPVRGSWGRLVSLARDDEELRSIVEHRMALGEHYKVIYLQKYVEKPGRDIRLFCLGGRVVAGIYRVSEHWVTNTARGGRAEPLKADPELEELAAKSCEALGVEFGGVDVVEGPSEGYMVLEVNGVPEYRNTVKVTGVDLSKLVLEHLVAKAKR